MDKDKVWQSWVQEEDSPKNGPTWETVFWVLAGWMATIIVFGYLLATQT